MTIQNHQIFVKTHVARDLLQNAALFKTDRLVIWEYVANSLQYVDSGVSPRVHVKLESNNKRITIKDNGRGMDWQGLQNFFVMHGENLDRKEGQGGRGRFGTGKSAAFGIAEVLRITTVRDKKRSQVELRRSEVQASTSEDPIPVRTLEREVPVDAHNGTSIEIEGVYLKTLDQAGIIRYVERHLARWPRNVVVFVNNHECEYSEPPVAQEKSFRPEGEARQLLGDVKLVLKVSSVPLDEDTRGVAIYSKGVWYESTLAGSEGRDMSHYIFGEIDVPTLDDDTSPIAPFDLSRAMRLNPNNELVRTIYAFVGQKVDEVRRELVAAERTRKQTEEAKKLAEQADDIARVINEDFQAFRQRVARARARAGGGVDAYSTQSGGDQADDLLFGAELPAEIVSPTGGPGPGNGGGGSGGESDSAPLVAPAPPDAAKQGRSAGGSNGRRKPYGGFQVKFEPMGSEAPRAKYQSDERTIYINLEHPQLAAARGLGEVDDPVFRRLAYEVAFSEYAIALASELAARGEYFEPSDAIFEIRETLNRVARKGAALYTA